MTDKKFLRVLYWPERFGTKQEISIFDGNINEEANYWKDRPDVKVEYYELKEVDK